MNERSSRVQHVRNRGAPPTKDELQGLLRAERLEPRWWSNGPGYEYGWHEHEYHKVLYCAAGSIVFHTRHGDMALAPGDRLNIQPGTEHAATVGPAGVTCVEAARHHEGR